jgi:RNA polymerase sigma-70 factor (ECF subfamily)
MAIEPTPVAALNRAVALAEVEGPAAALVVVDELDLDRYYLFHAIRADLLVRLGWHSTAALAYQAAIARCQNQAENAFLQQRYQEIAAH